MTSLVLELQKKASNSDVDILELLYNAKMVAHKLKIKEFEEWIDCEINGYSKDKDVPRYRKVLGKLYYQPKYTAQDLLVYIQDAEISEAICRTPITEKISKIQEGINKKGFSQTVPEEVASYLSKMIDATHENAPLLIRKTPPEELKTIVDSVRFEILEWTLKLEDNSVLGEDITHSEEEIKLAGVNKEKINITIHGDYIHTRNNLNTNGDSNNIIVGHINSNDDERINKNIETAINNEPSLKDKFKSIVLSVVSKVITNLDIGGIKNLCG